jgi:hypothetical protein
LAKDKRSSLFDPAVRDKEKTLSSVDTWSPDAEWIPPSKPASLAVLFSPDEIPAEVRDDNGGGVGSFLTKIGGSSSSSIRRVL